MEAFTPKLKQVETRLELSNLLCRLELFAVLNTGPGRFQTNQIGISGAWAWIYLKSSQVNLLLSEVTLSE